MNFVISKNLKKFLILAIAIFSIVIVSPLVSAQESQNIEGNKIDGYPVILAEEELFTIQTNVGSFSAKDRVEAITERLQEKAQDESFSLDSIQIKNKEKLTTLEADKILVTITEADARAVGKTREELAQNYREIIVQAVEKYREDNRLDRTALGIGATILATITLIILFNLLNQTLPKIYAKLDAWRANTFAKIRLRNLHLFPVSLLNLLLGITSEIIIGLLNLLSIILIIGIPCAYVTLVLSFFRSTKDLRNFIFNYLRTDNLFTIALIVFLAYYILIVLRFTFTQLGRNKTSVSGFHPEWSEPTYRLVSFLIIAITIVVIFPYLPGASSRAFQGLSVAIGILFSLGSTAAATNIVAGIILIYTRAFQIGDFVQIADSTGTIIDKTLLVTRIRTHKNVVITIPNSTILGGKVTNYSALVREQETPLVLHVAITLGYDVPWRKVYKVLLDAAHSTEHILEEPDSFILQKSLDDFYVSYELNAYTLQPSMMPKIYSELYQNIQDKCNEADIEILSPHYSAVRDGHQITIPAEYLPHDYTPPGFRVDVTENSLNQS